MIIMLGGFHTEKQELKALGDLLQGSGWTDVIVEAGIATPGTADALLKSIHVTKSRYSHLITYVALNKLLQEAHEEMDPTMLMEEWVAFMANYPTFSYWIFILKVQAIIFMFIRAYREGNFPLYVESLQALGPVILCNKSL